MNPQLSSHDDRRVPIKQPLRDTELLMYGKRITNDISCSYIVGRIIDSQRVRGEALEEVKDFIAEKRGE